MSKQAGQGFSTADWVALEELDARQKALTFAQQGPEGMWQLALSLRDHLRTVRPDWPTEQERAADLEAHVAFKTMLRRLGHGIDRR